MVQNIQVLRCFAALAVVLHHLQLRMHDQLGGPMLGFAGRAGVDVFFVISGFIMFHTTRNNDRTMLQFWTDRAIRIAPAYWMVTWAVVILFWLNLHPAGIRALSGGDIVADMLFLPDYRADGDVYPILDVGWTLNYEMYFYALFGLTFFLRSQASALCVLTGWFILTAIVRAYGPPLPHALEFFFEPITLEFAGGGGLALLYRRDLRLAPAAIKYLGYATLAAGVALMITDAVFWGEYVNWNPALRTVAFGIPAILIVSGALLLEKAGASVRSPTLMLLGGASYSIYLIHQLVLQYTLLPLEMLWPRPDAFGLIVIGVAAFAAATIAGVAMHLWIEKPVTERLHRFVKRGRHKKPAVAPAIVPAAPNRAGESV